MKTITLKIDEKTRFGKQFLSLVEFFTSEDKGVSVLKDDSKSGLEKALEDIKDNRVNSYKDSNELFEKVLG